LDSAGFGSNVTINKAISITAPPGVYAGITVFSGDGINVTAGAGDRVTLNGLTVISQGTSGNGVVFSAGARLHIENCIITGFGIGSAGILQVNGGLLVKDSVVKNCDLGINIASANASITSTMDHVTLSANATGLNCVANLSGGNINAAIIRSSVSDNRDFGIILQTENTGIALLDVESCLITNNGAGLTIFSNPTGTQAASISNCVITHNGQGFHVEGNNATLFTKGNNTIGGNATPDFGSLTPFAAR
jgi:hypothetical protein